VVRESANVHVGFPPGHRKENHATWIKLDGNNCGMCIIECGTFNFGIANKSKMLSDKLHIVTGISKEKRKPWHHSSPHTVTHDA